MPFALALATAANATEYDVSLQGRDTNPGAREAPFRTIQRAADVAQPGDTVTVHEGIYRERVNPPRGRRSDTQRIGTHSKLGPLWFAQVGEKTTRLHAQFPGVDPNQRRVEVNVRRTVFYPDAPGRNYITVRGFALRHAATPWAPPTAEQIGLIGTHWSRGWIIENNTVSDSVSSGIALGKHGDAHDNTSADTASHPRRRRPVLQQRLRRRGGSGLRAPFADRLGPPHERVRPAGVRPGLPAAPDGGQRVPVGARPYAREAGAVSPTSPTARTPAASPSRTGTAPS